MASLHSIHALDAFPDEILYIFLNSIDADSLFNFCKTSKKVKLLCKNSTFWIERILAMVPSRKTELINLKLDQLIRLYRHIAKSGKVYTFGSNSFGKLGLSLGIFSPAKTIPTLVNLDLKITQVSCGGEHTAFVTDQGYIYTFGYNSDYQLGHGDTLIRSVPKPIKDFNDVIQVSCGNFHTVFITSSGHIYIFGRSNYYLSSPVPLQIPGFNNVVQVACAQSHTAFVTDIGEAFIFGRNGDGQLGMGDTKDRNFPQKIKGFSNIRQIACGASHTAFITTEGKIYTFGSNKYYQLGLGKDIKQQTTPRQIEGFKGIIQVSCGEQHTAFVTEDNFVYTFGLSNEGELGYPQYFSYTPTQISGINDVIQVACGYHHTLILTKEGSVYSCGSGSAGNLGLGDDKNRRIPVKIPLSDDLKVMYVSGGNGHSALIAKFTK